MPSTHADRKITVHSHKHSFTPYPSLSPYSPTDGITERRIQSLHVGWRNFFPVVLLCQFFGFLRKIGFGVNYLRIQSTIQLWHCVSFLVLVGISFWYYIRTQCTIHLCGCVSVLVVVGNSVVECHTSSHGVRAYPRILSKYLSVRAFVCLFVCLSPWDHFGIINYQIIVNILVDFRVHSLSHTQFCYNPVLSP